MMRHSVLIYLFSLILLACHGSNASPHGMKRANGFDILASLQKRNLTEASSNTTMPFNQQLAFGFATQTNAVKELVAISQPSSVRNIQYLQNYVYDDRAGRGSWVYHLEGGVNFRKLSAEFPNVADQHLMTPLAASKGWKPWEDHSAEQGTVQTFHGTCVAGKALGQQYGVAKNAKLVVVAFAKEGDDMISAFEEIYKDLKSHPERQKHSVVTTSMIYGRNIDHVPAIFAVQDRGFPLIVAGSVDEDGQRSVWSQLGENTNAVGQDVTCLEDHPSQPTTGRRGTSFTAPQVAGQIANWLALDKVPFDTTSPYLVGNVRDYLESDAAGWVRSGTSRVLWNGVTEADNPQIPVKRCWGLVRDGDTYMYLERNKLASLIKDKFCDEAMGKGASYGAEYFQSTLNHVKISVVYTDPTRTRSKDECVRWLMELTDGCDATPDGNPANYKGGGVAKFDDVQYYIDPQGYRTPARFGLQGQCGRKYETVLTSYWVWGHGWASDDWGDLLLRRLKANGVGVTGWKFDYGDEDDGREWSAWFNAVLGAESRVERAIRQAGGPTDINCGGSGH